MKKSDSFYSFIILIFFLPIVLLILYMSAVSTTYITWTEQAFFLKDNVIVNILILPVFVALILFASRLKGIKKISDRIENDVKFYRIIKYSLVALVFAVTMIWVYMTQITPFADSGILHGISTEFLDGNYESFLGGDLHYIDVYPFQVRTLIWFVFIDRIFGGYSLMVYQTLNCIFIGVSFLALSNISLSMGLSKEASLLVIPCGILWVPVVFYSSFIYGNIPALGFALVALDLWIRYFNLGKIRFLLFSVLSMGMAYCMKSIFLVNLIAMMIYGVFKTISKKKAKRLLFAVASMAVVFVAATVLPHRYFVAKTGVPLDQGLPRLSWLEIGLSESVVAPGWYVDDPKVDYMVMDYKKAPQEELVKEHIANRIGYFKENPRDFLDFELRKTASMWNEPAGQSLWFMRGSQTELPTFVGNLISYRGYVKAVSLLDLMHLLIIFGCVLYALLFVRDGFSLEKMLMPMIFVGGFLFHLAWEAKAQYAFLYWVMVLPVAVSGYLNLVKIVNLRIDNESAGKWDLRILKIILMIITVAAITVLTITGLSSGLVKDNAAFANYLLENF